MNAKKILLRAARKKSQREEIEQMSETEAAELLRILKQADEQIAEAEKKKEEIHHGT